MREIRMVDLKAQYDKLAPEINTAIQSVIDSSRFIKGPEIGLFEEEFRKFLNVKHVVTCANGTDALYMALMVLGLQPGEEVITTNFTFISTVETIALLGLKPVLVEPDPDSYNISVEAVEKAITPKTRAIIPVHLFGQCSFMEKLMTIARSNNLYIIEDAAQASGADYFFSNGSSAKAGTMGDIGTTSFFPSKNLGGYGDGGAVFTNDDTIAGKIRSIANHGMSTRYHYDDIGVNSRLDTLQAAILRVKLRYLEESNLRRDEIAREYDKAFEGSSSVSIPVRMSYSSHIFHQYTIRVKKDKRDVLKDYLQTQNIPSMIYYPEPLHKQEAYRYLGYNEGDFPVTSSLCHEVISLPIHPEMQQEQIDHIISNVIQFFK